MDSNLKKDCQILIIFGRNILDTTGHQTTVQSPTSPNVYFALGENRTIEICVYALKWTKSVNNQVSSLQIGVLFRSSNNTALDRNVIFRWFCFPQVVQKQTLGEAYEMRMDFHHTVVPVVHRGADEVWSLVRV